ncbi:MAG: hypothetical protein A2X94_04695 [Bdellovibrionales bacterium GWB1_55_8]|nr:MAG: hypothetical protein A2X94_04695 [Bdellovibrionales bacterium GWB1_55_8]
MTDQPKQPGHILLVEDDRDILESMTELLDLEGFRTDTAGNGQDALSRLENFAELPDLILLDLMMPIMDGVEFRLRQKAHPRLSSIPVIILSADGRAGNRLSREDSAPILRKPVDIQNLLDVIRQTMTSRSPK